ncbi:hypothetical protein BC827DRAFT_1232078 [Russula dissimulans]|nr:hypothetical protein BC827DRAFT_1232078 [Russula dissimulans]
MLQSRASLLYLFHIRVTHTHTHTTRVTLYAYVGNLKRGLAVFWRGAARVMTTSYLVICCVWRCVIYHSVPAVRLPVRTLCSAGSRIPPRIKPYPTRRKFLKKSLIFRTVFPWAPGPL